MTTRKPGAGKTGAKKLKVKKQTLKDLGPKGGKKVAGGLARGGTETMGCGVPPKAPQTFVCGPYTVGCGTAMTQCKQITCA